MAKVTGLTAQKMLELSDEQVIGGSINSSKSLILRTRGGSTIDAGNVAGPPGDPGPAGPPGMGGGTQVQRDSIFGVPTTSSAQVALANQNPTWYNTEKSWLEGYFAPTGLAGLTGRPLLSGHPAGWYPLMSGALMGHRAVKSGFQSISTTSGGEMTPVLAASDTLIGGLLESGTAGYSLPLGGYYRVGMKAYLSGGTSPLAGMSLRINGTDVGVGAMCPKPDSQDQAPYSAVEDVYTAGTALTLKAWKIAGASMSIWGTNRTNGVFFEVTYLRPPFLNY